MGLIDLASYNSFWRGLDYYEDNKVIDHRQLNKNQYEGCVKGRGDNVYHVFLDIEHPRKSKCDCPHAKDRRVICKHIIALYFEIFPKEALEYRLEMEKSYEEYESSQAELERKVFNYINSLTKEELKHVLWNLLQDSPDWVYERFINSHIK